MEAPSYNLKNLDEKLDKSEDLLLYSVVNSLATSYFTTVSRILVEADKRKEIDYDVVQDQIHALYIKLKKGGLSRNSIFNEIVKKLTEVTMGDTLCCQILVSFFIEKCEVFDAIAK